MFSNTRRLVLMIAAAFVITCLAFGEHVYAASSNVDAYFTGSISKAKVIEVGLPELRFKLLIPRYPHYLAHMASIPSFEKKGGCSFPTKPMRKGNHKIVDFTVSLKYCI